MATHEQISPIATFWIPAASGPNCAIRDVQISRWATYVFSAATRLGAGRDGAGCEPASGERADRRYAFDFVASRGVF